MKTLFLASQSMQRQQLLQQAGISYNLISHTFHENIDAKTTPLPSLVEAITIQKMNHAQLPHGKENESIIVLTADTMGQDAQGSVHGKPRDKAEAVNAIKALCGTGTVATSFCLDIKKYTHQQWQTQKRMMRTVQTRYQFIMPEHWVERYLEEEPEYMNISGAITVEGFGQQFLKIIEGSYSALLGLPMFELREALEEINFYE